MEKKSIITPKQYFELKHRGTTITSIEPSGTEEIMIEYAKFYSDIQNAELKKENEELKELLSNSMEVIIDNQYHSLKSKADELYEALDELTNHNINISYTFLRDRDVDIYDDLHKQAKQALENYKK